MEIKVLLITQARTGSTRLPGKVLKKIQGKELLQIHLERLSYSQSIGKIIVATTQNKEDDEIVKLSDALGFACYRGSENDVLDRFYKAANLLDHKPEWIVRVTSDCPLIDAVLLDQIVEYAKKKDVDYVSNTFLDQYPDGQDVEVFRYSALELAWQDAVLDSEREHVTPYIKNNSNLKGGLKFKALNFPSEQDYSKVRMTVDEPEDVVVIDTLVRDLGTRSSWIDYTNYVLDHGLFELNSNIIRNEGYKKSLKKDKNGQR